MATGSSLVDVIKSYRQVYHQEHSHLSRQELERGWISHWKSISNEATDNFGSGNILAPKRLSSIVQVGTDSSSKRTGHRQVSAPAGHTSKQSRPAMHPTPASLVGSVNIPQRPSARRASNPTSASSQSLTQPGLANIDEARMYSTNNVLARSLEGVPPPPIWLAASPTTVERGEYATHATQVAASNQAGDSPDGMLTPPISDSGLTTASTALSQPMTRSNTDDVLHGVDMMRVDSQSSSELPDIDLHEAEHDDLLLFDDHGTIGYDGFSYSAVDSFSFGSEMKHCASQDVGNTSSHQSAHVQNSHIIVPTRGQELRRLEPKQSYDSASHQKPLASSEVRLVEMTLEDGTKVKKAEISRAARQQPQRKTIFCRYCNEQPNGFHGDHELNRHIDRQHRSIRKVWICKDISSHGFLDGCKACRNHKTYGANYNAAAHLRRTHFNPCKNKRGGRGKKSEGRGGIGGGNKPSMEELKHWMYAVYETVINGEVVDVRPIPAEGQEDMYAALVTPPPAPVTVDLSDMAMADDFNNFGSTVPADQPSSYEMSASLPSNYQMMMMVMAPQAEPPLQISPVPTQQQGNLSYMHIQTEAIYNDWPRSHHGEMKN
ncbi:hypothetical protein DV736_g431, partial [Chaetothyriales sp. CBS 134916]